MTGAGATTTSASGTTTAPSLVMFTSTCTGATGAGATAAARPWWSAPRSGGSHGRRGATGAATVVGAAVAAAGVAAAEPAVRRLIAPTAPAAITAVVAVATIHGHRRRGALRDGSLFMRDFPSMPAVRPLVVGQRGRDPRGPWVLPGAGQAEASACTACAESRAPWELTPRTTGEVVRVGGSAPRADLDGGEEFGVAPSFDLALRCPRRISR